MRSWSRPASRACSSARASCGAAASRAGSRSSSSIVRLSRGWSDDRVALRPFRASTRRAGRRRRRSLWEGETISYGELAEMAERARYAEVEAAKLPVDRPVGLRARKSPGSDRARSRPASGTASVSASVGRARAGDTGAALRAGGRQPGARAARPAERRARACAPSRSRGRVEEAAGQWPPADGRRRHLVHAHDLGVDRAAQGRSASGGRGRPLHRLGRLAIRHRPGDGGRELRAAQFRSLPARHLDDAQARAVASCSSTRTARRRARTSPTCSPAARSTCSRPCRCSTGC